MRKKARRARQETMRAKVVAIERIYEKIFSHITEQI